MDQVSFVCSYVFLRRIFPLLKLVGLLNRTKRKTRLSYKYKVKKKLEAGCKLKKKKDKLLQKNR